MNTESMTVTSSQEIAIIIKKDTIIVKSAQALGWKDKYTHWWATNGEYYQRSLSYIGAFPLMYGGGHNTFVG